MTVSLCILSHFLCCYRVQEYHYTTLLPVLPVLLWLWQRESVPRFRRLLMTSFVVSLLVFVPTLSFLARPERHRFENINLLERVVPVVVAFFCLTVYGAASTWVARRRPRLITTQMRDQIWPTLRLGGVLGVLLGSVLAAAYLTVPSRLLSPLSKWKDQDYRRHYEESIAQLQRALALAPTCAEAHNNLGNALAGRGQVDSAIAHYQRALEIKPDYAEAHNNLALALAGRGEVDSAIAHYRKALEIEPDYAEAHHNLALALAGHGEVDSAIAHYQKSLEIKPDLAEAHNNLALALADRGQVDLAIAHYRKALKIKPDFAEAHNNLGNALAGRGQVDLAIAQYEKALEIKPHFVEAHYDLALVLAGHGEVDLAIAHYQKALEIKPHFAEAHYDLALVLARRGQVELAIAHYHKALQIKPDFVKAHNNLAWLQATCPAATLRNGAEAVEHAQRANQLCGSRQPGLLDTLAAAQAEAGRFSEAAATGAEPWSWPGNKTTTLWRMSYGPGSHCTKRESPITRRRRLPHCGHRNLDSWQPARELTRKLETLCGDHCHAAGRVRGLVCSHCKTCLGQTGDDPKRLKKAARYLEQRYTI